MNKLILGLVAFFGIHSISLLAVVGAIARPRLGTRLAGIYSIASLLGFFARQRLSSHPGAAEVLYVTPAWCRYIAALLMLPAFTSRSPRCCRGASKPRPTSAAAGDHALGPAHLLTNGSVTDVLLFGTFLVWSVAVRISLIVVGPPGDRFSGSAANDAIAVIAGIALYVAFLLGLHAWWIGVPILGA
jgi:uncharacterized membrane protein